MIPLIVEPSSPDAPRSARHGEPFTLGVPVPRGAAPAGLWRLTDGSGRDLPVQTRTLDRWPDGSTRWLLVDGRLTAPASGSAALRLAFHGESRAAGFAPIVIQEKDSAITVDVGVARFRMAADGAFPFDQVEIDGRPLLERKISGLAIQFASGDRCTVVPAAVRVEERGPVRTSIAVEGTARARDGATIECLARVDFFAQLPTVKVAIRLRNPRPAKHPGNFWDLGDAGSVLIEDASVSWQLAASAGTASVSCSPEPNAATVTGNEPIELYQDSSGGANWQSTNHINRERSIPNTFRGYRLKAGAAESHGLRATPIMSVTHGRDSVAVAVPQFWQNFPKAIEGSPTGVTLRLFPGQYADVHELQGGEQKTHTCFVAFGADRISDLPLEWCRHQSLVTTDPAWILASGAVPFLERADEAHFELIRSAIDGPTTFEQKREVIDEFGWRHFGDVYGDHEAVKHKGPTPLVSHYNNQYDTVAGFFYQFSRTGDARWRTLMFDLASHVVDIDVYHTQADKAAYNHGLFWHTYHYGDADTATHRTYPSAANGTTHGGGPSPDHNYTTGLMFHYFATGEIASRDTVIDLAQFVIDADDGRKTPLRWLSGGRTGFATASGSYSYHGPGRGPANSLNALVDGHRLSGDRRFLDKAEEIIRRVVHPAANVEAWRLDDPENKWFYLMFLQSLGKYLAYKIERHELDSMYAYARGSLLRCARWMADHEYPYLERPERLTFPTETWAAHEIRKSDVFYHASLHAAGAERARFLERGRFFFHNSLETLATRPTRALARPVIVLMSSGLMHTWIAAHPGESAPAPANPSESFGAPEAFVPQKQQAIKRLKLLMAAGAGLVLIALLLLLASRW